LCLEILVITAAYPLVTGLNPTLGSVDIQNNCIQYNNEDRLITISCSKPLHLKDVYNRLQGSNVLDYKEDSGYKIWILNAGILVDKGSTFIIDSTDTTWLKIVADGTHGYPISVLGSLKIDSVGISSWDPKTNDYVRFKFDVRPDDGADYTGVDTVPRPFIRVEEGATGTTDITNSELAYLGYEDKDDSHGRSGLLYYGGDGSVIKGNYIHNVRFGFYSSGVGNIVLEDNYVDHTYMYGFDPHTGTHDMIIRNNTVHDNGAMGIICSLDCYNITIEDNTVYKSTGSGIMFSRNMHDSIARNNVVYDQEKCIFLSQSHNNEVYDNSVANCDRQGIYIHHNSNLNKIYHNKIDNSTQSITVTEDSKNNDIHSNTVSRQEDNKQNEESM
jgi:poly(beta-D-mannuronate) C5 epimerase